MINDQRKKYSIRLTIAALIAAGAIFYYFNNTAPIYWEKGAAQIYRISGSTFIYAKNPGSASIYDRLELKGILNFRIYEIKKDIVKAGIQLYPLQVIAEGRRIESAEKLYSRLFFAEIKNNGEFIKFHFNNGIAVDDEKSIKDIITSFQFIIKKSFFSKWNTEETDRNGSYKAAYTLLSRGKINKSKIEYIEKPGDKNTSDTGGKTVIKRSELTVRFGKPWSWIKNAEGRELTVFYSKNRPLMKVSSSFSLKITDLDPDRSLAIWNDSLKPDRQIYEWKTNPKNTLSIADQAEKNMLKQKFGSKYFNIIADEVFNKYRSFNSQCIQTLMEFLKLYPHAAAMFPGYLLAKKLNPAQRVMLVHVLGRTGTEEAQEALTVIMKGEEFPVESRKQAAIAFGSIKKPISNAVDSLWQIYENRDTDANSKGIANAALLSLGSIAKNPENRNNAEYKNISEIIKNRIAADLADEDDLNTTVALLHAAGNTADESFIEPISRFLNDENPRIRTAAVTSMAYMDDEKVTKVLIDILDDESNVNVRNAVVAAMYRKLPSPEAIEKIMEMLPDEENDIVRGRMYRYLLKNREFRGVKEQLRKMLRSERVMENRRIIYNALYTNKKAGIQSNLN